MSNTDIRLDSLEPGHALGQTNTSEPDYQDVLRLEFTKLQREYRSLENKRRTIAQQDGYIRKRTDRIMPLLEREYDVLQYEMENATSRTHMRIANNHAMTMKEALQTFDLYQQEINKKFKQIEEIERHVDRITDKVVKQRIKMLAMHGMTKSMAQREMELKRAEDKLYHLTCTFNLQIHENKRLREEIMDYLMDRAKFFKMHNSVKRHIGQAKKQMLNIVQLAIQTYDNRDEAMSKVKALREREAKETKQHGLEVQEFERTLHHDKSILGFVKVKLKKRPAIEDAADRRMRVGTAKEKELDGILKRYSESFKKILKYSNTRSILDLVDKYNSLDTNNFEAFKFVTNLNNECEVLREEIERLKNDIADAHMVVEKRERDDRHAQQQLQLSIIDLQEQLETMKREVKSNKKRNAEIYETIGAAVVVSDCDTTPIMRMLGNTEGVGEHNVLLCFTQLDIKITEIKCERDRLKEIKSNHTNLNTLRPVLTKTKVPTSYGGPYAPKLMMLHAEGVEDEDSKVFEQEPYYYDEMREYVFQKLIEDKLIDLVQRSLSVSQKKDFSSTYEKSSSRKTLIERVRQSQLEDPGRKKKKKLHEGLVGDATSGETDDDGKSSSKKIETIHKLAQEAQNKLVKSSSRGKSMATGMGHSEMRFDEDYPPPEDDDGVSISQSYHTDYRHVTPVTDYDDERDINE